MLANKKKIPGFGHRVYRTEDPRATHLRALSEELGRRTGHLDLYLTSKKIEETIKEQKGLNANVDFYSASTYYSLGIPIDLFTPIFAVSRMSGWTAHVLEQYRNNRLIRPRADYTGKPVGEKWIPIGERSDRGAIRNAASRSPMHDLSFFRTNLDSIAQRLATRGYQLDVEQFRALDARAPLRPDRSRATEGAGATSSARKYPSCEPKAKTSQQHPAEEPRHGRARLRRSMRKPRPSTIPSAI